MGGRRMITNSSHGHTLPGKFVRWDNDRELHKGLFTVSLHPRERHRKGPLVHDKTKHCYIQCFCLVYTSCEPLGCVSVF